MLPVMKMTDHMIGDRVSVRCRNSYRVGDAGLDTSWLGGRVIGREANAKSGVTRYVVQLDDDRRVVAFDADVRRWSFAFELYETLEKMAS